MQTNSMNHWKTLLAGAFGAAAVLAPDAAQAQQAQPQQQVAQAAGPVTAISELTDVQPTDWAFQALQSLVERYGCIAGYPDRTYRGNRAMTRFEFAAGMNACLDRINELIAAGLADKVSKEDLATLQRLQEEFQAELAALRGRADKLEGDVKKLQGQVFNPVTKLNIEVITALLGSALSENRDLNGNGVIGDVAGEARSNQANMTLPYRVRLNFDASFVGRDQLRIRLQAREANTQFYSGDTGTFFSGGSPSNNITLAKLFYRFRAFGNTDIFAGVTGSGVFDIFKYVTPFDSALSDFVDAPNSTGDVPGGTAIGFTTDLSPQFSIAYSYSSANAQRLGTGFGDSGVTGGDSSHAVELGFTPTKSLGLFFQFATTYVQNGDAGGAFLANGASLFRGSLFTPTAGFSPASARVNAFSVAANLEITPRIIFSGWFSAGTIDYTLPARVPAGAIAPGSEDFNGFLAGFAFPDLFVEGSLGSIAFGQPLVSTASGVTRNRPFLVDVSYSFAVNRFLKLTPSAYFISNPNGGGRNGGNDPTIGVGALRATFSY